MVAMSLILKVDPEDPDPAVIREAADMIREGLVVAFPTDTLYGLAVDPRNEDAVRRLYELKGRSEGSALTLIAADAAHARAAGDMTPHAERLAARFWPGPLTIVVRARPILARGMLAGGGTVGIRIPDHVVAIALARDAGFCVTATSANRSGATAAATPAAVAAALPDVDAILDAGAARGGAPSTIVDASAREVALVRQGVVPWERVLKSLQ
jgi:L-threonylcarbamoyladenylate synthase